VDHVNAYQKSMSTKNSSTKGGGGNGAGRSTAPADNKPASGASCAPPVKRAAGRRTADGRTTTVLAQTF